MCDKCDCAHRVDYGACDVFEAGANGRCVYCDHAEGCHPGEGKYFNGPLGPVGRMDGVSFEEAVAKIAPLFDSEEEARVSLSAALGRLWYGRLSPRNISAMRQLGIQDSFAASVPVVPVEGDNYGEYRLSKTFIEALGSESVQEMRPNDLVKVLFDLGGLFGLRALFALGITSRKIGISKWTKRK